MKSFYIPITDLYQCYHVSLNYCNGLYKYLSKNNYLYEKQFGFQAAHSTEHAVIQLISQILQAFNENDHTIGIFIDLSKAFDIVDHDLLLTKIRIVWN